MSNVLKIRDNYEKLISVFVNRDTSMLKSYVKGNVLCFFNNLKYNLEGSQHSLFGLRDFFDDLGEINGKIKFGDFYCLLEKNKEIAHQYGTALWDCGKKFRSSLNTICKWEKNNDEWFLSELRIDFVDTIGEEIHKVENDKYMFRDTRIIVPQVDSIWIDTNWEDSFENSVHRFLFSINNRALETLSEMIDSKFSKPNLVQGLYKQELKNYVFSIDSLKENKAVLKNVVTDEVVCLEFTKYDKQYKCSNFDLLIRPNFVGDKKIEIKENENALIDFINKFTFYQKNHLFESLGNLIDDRYGYNATRYNRKVGYRNLLKLLINKQISGERESFPIVIDSQEKKENHIYATIYTLFDFDNTTANWNVNRDANTAYGKYEIELVNNDGWKLLYVYGEEGIFEIKRGEILCQE